MGCDSEYPLLELIEGEVRKVKPLPAPTGPGNLDLPLDEARPLILNFGAGVDSTAMSLKLLEHEVIPDMFIFADTGGEKPETIAWKDEFGARMEAEGWPALVTVQKNPRGSYRTLLENCIVNKTLPSLAFGRGGCSIKWKHKVMDRYIMGGGRGEKRVEPSALWVMARATGVKPTKLIGYDNGPKDSRRKINTHESPDFFFRYPLREEWQMDRVQCEATIRSHGLVVPPKSSCFFCPAMQVVEVEWLFEHHPDLFLMALWCEAIALPGLDTVGGLWRNTRKMDRRPASWLAWADHHKGWVTASWENVTQTFRPWRPEDPKTNPVFTYPEIREIRFTSAAMDLLRSRGHDPRAAQLAALDVVLHCERIRDERGDL